MANGRGQALVEFALVITLVVLGLMGLFDVGRAVFQSNSLANAAREGARFAIVHQDQALIAQRIEALTFAGEVTNAGETSLVRYFRPNDDGTVSGEVCTPVRVGCIAVVNPQSEWTAVTPIIGSIVGPITLEGRSELPVEFVCPNPAIPTFSTSASCPKQP